MIVGRDSRGRFMRKQVVPKAIGGRVVKLERVQVICPACGEQVEVVARDGHVKGYCAVANQHVDFLIETQGVPAGKHLTAETEAKISAALKGRQVNGTKGMRLINPLPLIKGKGVGYQFGRKQLLVPAGAKSSLGTHCPELLHTVLPVIINTHGQNVSCTNAWLPLIRNLTSLDLALGKED